MSQPTLMARKVARELTAEELDLVSGGGTVPGKTPSGSVMGTGCTFAPPPGGKTMQSVYQCADASIEGSPMPGPGGGPPSGPAAPL